MDGRTDYRLVSFALAFIVFVGPTAAGAQQALNHPGRVVEMGTGMPLSVDIRAWPESLQTGLVGDCPLFGNVPLASATSLPKDGQFQLNVDAKRQTYTATYCAIDYFPRADRDIPNRGAGSPVIPFPVGMFARKSDAAAYERTVRYRAIALYSDLAYLRSVNPGQFEKVMNSIAVEFGEQSSARRQALQRLSQSVLQWASKP